MIFSKQKMDAAFEYASIYFDKILTVNFEEDTFSPIKVSEYEWEKLDKRMSFTNWIRHFINSDDSIDADDLLMLANKVKMLSITNPKIFNYKKKIDGNYHEVQLELFPIGSGIGYLFVRDLTKMQEEIKNEI